MLESDLSEVLRPKEAKEEEASKLRDLLHELTKSKSRRKQALTRLEHARDKLKQVVKRLSFAYIRCLGAGS